MGRSLCTRRVDSVDCNPDEAESNGLHEEGGFATATHRLWPCFQPKMAEMNLDDLGRQEPQLALFPEKR